MNIETKLLLFYLSLEDFEKREFKELLSEKARKILLHPNIGSMLNYLNNLSHNSERGLNSFFGIRNSNQYLNQIPYNKENVPSHMERDSAIMQIVRKIEDTVDSNLSFAKTIESLIGIKITRKEKRSKTELRGILIDGLMSSPKGQLLKIKNQLIKKMYNNQLVPESESNLDKWFSIILENKK